MLKIKTAVLVLAALGMTACAAMTGHRETRILFLGNSFVYANDLPGLLTSIARSKGEYIKTEAVAPGGYTLKEHSSNSETLSKITQGNWDFVVLQEQSQKPAFPDRQLQQEVIPYALALDKAIRKSGTQTKTVFYETWGYKNGDARNCKPLPDLCTYSGMQDHLSKTYEYLAGETGGILAPVGEAWRRVRAAYPEIELYAPDGIHPSQAGSYLAACVFYGTLFGNPAGAAAKGIPQEQAAKLQAVAWETVQPTRISRPAGPR